MLLGKAKTAVVAAVSMALTACALLTWNVRTGDVDWLAKCPPDSRRAANDMDFRDGASASLLVGPNVIYPAQGGVEVRDGYVEAQVAISTRARGYIGRLAGEMRTGSDGASLHFTNFRLGRLGDPDEGPLTGPEVAICAIAAVRGDPNYPGIPKVTTPARPAELHPGYVFVTTGALEIQFAR